VSKQKEWLSKNCRELKHEKGKAGELLNLMKEVKEEKSGVADLGYESFYPQFLKPRLKLTFGYMQHWHSYLD
jgi:hypothetical protein